MPPSSVNGAAGAVCARLRGVAVPLPPDAVEVAREHGVHLLLAERMTVAERQSAGLEGEQRTAAVVEAWRARQAASAIDALAAAGVPSIVFKGAALAQTHYARPFLRPRGDLDLMIDPSSLDAAAAALAAAGWTPLVEPPSTVISAQRHFQFVERGLTEQLDLHWAVANARVFASAVAFEDLLGRSVAVPALGSRARVAAPADALLIACIHRVAHHFDVDRLLWLWDIHVLAESLTADARDAFVARARAARMRAVCARGLERAAAAFGTGAGDLLARLAVDEGEPEPSASFLDASGRTVGVLASDLRYAGSWAERSRLLREHLLPPREYMSARYPGWPAALLPLAYAYRIARGAPAWFRR